jgi:hypothetical protein
VNDITAHQVLTIIAWFLLAILLVLMLLIARLYQRVSGRQTFFWAFAVPIALFGVASARYAFNNQVGGDPLGDVLWGLGGALLFVLCVYVFTVMTARR